ncbi:MAG: hypothetical protein OK454_08830 [Thaumarchaeota archaeon]|nr:hypothetical protein [Nitrososphaerota archaeon]
MTLGFRRICLACRRPVDWTDQTGFFHLDDKTPLEGEGGVDLEVVDLDIAEREEGSPA